jgi:mycothiol synthase
VDLDWISLTDGRLPGIVDLYRRCLAVDGGLPASASAEFVRNRYAGRAVTAVGACDAAGELVAAGSVRRARGFVLATGQVAPAHRRRGLGAELLDRLLDAGRGMDGRLAVETESLTADADALFTSRGLRRSFAEDVFRLAPATPLPAARLPGGVAAEEWTGRNEEAFYEAYRASFAERPEFPGWTQQQWAAWTTDDDFRPGHSLLARAPDGSPAGFVTCARDFLIQVGTVPRWRGRGLARALAVAALARMRAAGAGEVFLDVNVDNPASAALFRGMGWRPVARRARYTPTDPPVTAARPQA